MKSRVALLASLALAGCGGSEPAAKTETKVAEAEAPKACAIITAADAAAALGHEVKKLDATGGAAGLDICQFGYQGERLMDTGNASVTVHSVNLASLKQGVTAEGYSTEAVPGLGDEAFWSKDAGLYVGKGNRSAIYLAAVGGEDDAKNKERAITLARATVSRL
jgi:hypothetical protein